MSTVLGGPCGLGVNRSGSGSGVRTSRQQAVLNCHRPRNDCRPKAILRQGSSSAISRAGNSSSFSTAKSSTRTSAAFGARVQSRSSPAPFIHGTVTRRGGRIIISAVLAGVENAVKVESVMSERIKGEPNLVVGQLDNGMQYVILPNKLPPTRFEAHLEIHAGSVDELPNEQGIAHLVEHVTFLGSKRRENLLGTGARANAYTDFHHTVFHVHAPITSTVTGSSMLPQVLEALEEIAFKPEFLATRIEKERKAVMAEAQMMNTIEYRVDCQLLQHLHYENNLGCRFPIGKMDQVQTWPHSQLREFWKKWYFPANATLFVVGDLDRDIEATKALINKVFGRLPAPRMTAAEARSLRLLSDAAKDGHQPPAYILLPDPSTSSTTSSHDAHANGNEPKHSDNGNGNGVGGDGAVAVQQGPESGTPVLVKQRHPVRPPVVHNWGFGPLKEGEGPAEIRVFRHPLLQHFMLSLFCKLPIQAMTEMSQLKSMLMLRIILSVFQFRVNKRYVAGDPRFIRIELDISDSAREACAVSTLTISSEPKDWEGAVATAVQEMRRLQKHGITQGELDRYVTAILRDSAQLAQQANKIPSLDTLNFVMESLACGHTVMSHADAHAAMEAVGVAVTLEEVNTLARSLLTFASDYGNEAEPLAQAESNPSLFALLGPTRTTSVVACLPAYTQASGEALSVGGDQAARNVAAMGAAGHLDADTIDLAELEAASKKVDEFDVPEGAVKFDVSPAEMARVLSDRSYEVDAVAEIPIPKHLIDPETIAQKVATMNPHFVPLDAPSTSSSQGEGEAGSSSTTVSKPPPESFSGITQRRLSNGIRINYRHTDNEPQAALLRLIVPGGRAAESMGEGPDGFGAVCLGTRTLSEAGSLGKWKREEVEVFCIANLIDCALDADEENLVKDYHFAVGKGSMQAAFEMIHLFLAEPNWDEEAMRRAKTAYLSNTRSVGKSLDRASMEKIMSCMMGPKEQRKFRDLTVEEIEALTLEGMRKTVQGLLHTGALEVNVVGDFDPQELEENLLKYLGTIPPSPPETTTPLQHTTISFTNPSFEERHMAWHLQDSDERATAYIAGPAPARWGPFGNFDPLPAYPGPVLPPPPIIPNGVSKEEREKAIALRRGHPLYSSCVLMLLQEIINSRLFTTVRDSLGLTYDVSFEVTMFDRVRAGWFSVQVTSHPNKIYDALDASVAVLRDIAISPINRRELSRAKTTLLTRHESDMKDNTYWLGLLTHCLNPHVPWKSIECLRDLKPMYEAITVEDVYHAYKALPLDDDSLFTCVGTSGKQQPDPPEERYVGGIGSGRDDEWEPANAGNMWSGSPSYPSKKPSKPAQPQQQNQTQQGQQGEVPTPISLMTALLAAAQSVNLKQALKNLQQTPTSSESSSSSSSSSNGTGNGPLP